ncbi:PorT family protein [Sabulilitoribacter multivorans]|uniref:PorT family protein n=1 Tax=Flaviramulus multivorans TaxID=1304750 RepID=A0ABS9IJR3_9FLAO|nr:outer membrane beta-barrel protein [Flaviramulus multivorans]MCF7560825.1 PorT family protein [Flaviramulus multivorans]
MKKINSLISLCFIVTLISSCAVRGGYHAGNETYRYSGGISSVVGPTQKSATSSKSSSAFQQIKNTTSESGFFIGIYFTDIELSEKLELQPEIDFVGIKDLNQLQAPVLVKYGVAEKFDVLAGPNFGYLLDAPDGIKSFNLGVDVGAAYEFVENFNLNARYGFGLTNLLENTAGDASSKLSGFQIGIGYKF